MSTPVGPLPRWIDIGVLPIVNLMMALIVAGLIVLIIGENPLTAIGTMASGAFGNLYGIGYTLYYATNFIFTGLAVAVAFHAGLFNIGGEGQAYIGGLGAGVAALAFDHSLTLWPMMAVGLLACALFGAGWAAIPAYLQAKRGSHIVITTIMFNFLATALMNYLLVYVFRQPGDMQTVSRSFGPSAAVPKATTLLASIGMPDTPLNLAFVWALICCGLVWVYLWRSRGGYELRTTGLSPRAAQYAGISPDRITIEAMLISGALAGFLGFNEIMGVHGQLLLDFVSGAGFTGIAVALMGRNHPLGIVLASILFGALYQGGAELAFDMPDITRDMIVVMQGLVILFSGALAYMNRPLVARLWGVYQTRRKPVGSFAKPEAPAAETPAPAMPAAEPPAASAPVPAAAAPAPVPAEPAASVSAVEPPAPPPPPQPTQPAQRIAPAAPTEPAAIRNPFAGIARNAQRTQSATPPAPEVIETVVPAEPIESPQEPATPQEPELVEAEIVMPEPPSAAAPNPEPAPEPRPRKPRKPRKPRPKPERST